ncbi:MAG: heme A synthase [Pseudomonadota bacterium]
MSTQRSIFEEVASEAEAETRAAPTKGVIDKGRTGSRAAVRIWLMVLFAFVVLMIVVGGLTRLTDSGLSITEWNVVTGAIPPLNAVEWQSEFEKYREIPEYQLQNKGMSLEEFKVIYWWEWGHRQLGRVIGLIWAVGFFGLLLFRKMPSGWTGRLFLIGALGGLQGAIGWWMVSSGLTGTMLDVASYRLATHLGLAFIILGFITWYSLHMSRPERELMQARRDREGRLFSMSTGVLHFVFIQILLGALVAGIDAGRSFTDWPLMGGSFVPMQFWMPELGINNFFENAGFVQFIHRKWGYLVLAYALFVWYRSRSSAHARTRRAFNLMMLALLAQIALGIVTVLYAAPWEIAIVHQLLAVAVWVLILRARFLCQYPVAQSIRG